MKQRKSRIGIIRIYKGEDNSERDFRKDFRKQKEHCRLYRDKGRKERNHYHSFSGEEFRKDK
jgi:hypothetical protein